MRRNRFRLVIAVAMGCTASLSPAVTAPAAAVAPRVADTYTAPALEVLPLNGTPVTLTVGPGQEAIFAISARAGERLWIGCRLSTYEDLSPGRTPAMVAFLHARNEFTVEHCRHPHEGDYPTVFTGYVIPASHPESLHSLHVDPVSPEANTVTVWAYKIPPSAEASAAVDGTRTSVETTVPGQQAVVRFPGIKGMRYTVTCDLAASTRQGIVTLAGNLGDAPGVARSTECRQAGSFTTGPLQESGDVRLNAHFAADGIGTFLVTVKPAG